MSKVLWGVFCLVVIVTVLSFSSKQDEARSLAFDKCVVLSNSHKIDPDSRQRFLTDCMQ